VKALKVTDVIPLSLRSQSLIALALYTMVEQLDTCYEWSKDFDSARCVRDRPLYVTELHASGFAIGNWGWQLISWYMCASNLTRCHCDE